MEEYWLNSEMFQNVLKTGSSPLGVAWTQFGALMQKPLRKRRKKAVLFGDIRDLIGYYRRQVEEERRLQQEFQRPIYTQPIGPETRREAAQALASGQIPVQRGAEPFLMDMQGVARIGSYATRPLTSYTPEEQEQITKYGKADDTTPRTFPQAYRRWGRGGDYQMG